MAAWRWPPTRCLITTSHSPRTRPLGSRWSTAASGSGSRCDPVLLLGNATITLSMIRFTTRLICFAVVLSAAGCGYHTLGSAAHLPPDVRTLSIPVFATRTDAYHTEAVMTQAVIREFAARTRLRVTPSTSGDFDAVLHGAILRQAVAPLTYN